MTTTNLFFSIVGVLLVVVAAQTTILILYFNARIGTVNLRIDALQTLMNQRFTDMVELWRAELHRVEEVLDARLKHLEEN